MKVQTRNVLAGIALLAPCWSAQAYKEETHQLMSTVAVKRSVLASQAKLNQLGLRYGVEDKEKQTFPIGPSKNSPGPHTVLGAIERGSYEEDHGVKDWNAINHFFNPLNNTPLSMGGFNVPSPDWALEDRGAVISNIAGPQDFSYRLANSYFLQALIAPTKEARDLNWGKTFRALGHVIHHIQDMAQPQHVRNDMHLDDDRLKSLWIYNPSTYEQWVSDIHKTLRDVDAYPAYDPVYSPTSVGRFRTARHFWTTSPGSMGTGGMGMAEYTNRGFFSMGSAPPMDGPFPEPIASQPHPVDVETLCKEVQHPATKDPLNSRFPCPDGVSGNIEFSRSTVTDSLRPEQTQDNLKSLAHSVYNWDLKQRGFLGKYTLNRFTYDAATPLLIPRAISYSAGLLNFFFRGEMTISLPSGGIYAAVDHTREAGNHKTTGGFRSIRLRIQNTTPAAVTHDNQRGIEPMEKAPGGKLYAVAKFHKNNCYEPDLSGEYGAPNIDWRECRRKVQTVRGVGVGDDAEEIVVSAPIPVPSGIDAAPQEVTFTFETPVPISATDLFLQVVYNGPLGEESRAIAVATKDISEPTFGYAFDSHDQYKYAHYPAISINGGGMIYTWPDWCRQAMEAGDVSSEAECNERLWPTKRAYQFSPTNAPIPGWDPANPPVPQGEWTDISLQPELNPAFVLSAPVGSYARVALLTDAPATNAAIVVHDWNGKTHTFYWLGGVMQGATNQLDIQTGTMVTSQKWSPARGVHVSPTDAEFINRPMEPGVVVQDLKPHESLIKFPPPLE